MHALVPLTPSVYISLQDTAYSLDKLFEIGEIGHRLRRVRISSLTTEDFL